MSRHLELSPDEEARERDFQELVRNQRKQRVVDAGQSEAKTDGRKPDDWSEAG